MSDGLNQWTGVGNLGQDPDLKVTAGGQAILKLSLGCNDNYLDRNNVRQERVEWVRIAIWGRRAEALAKILHKGDKVCIVGRLQTSSYEKNGEKRWSTEIVATNVILCGSRPGGASAGGGGGQQRPNAPAAPRDDGPPDNYPSGGSEDDIPF